MQDPAILNGKLRGPQRSRDLPPGTKRYPGLQSQDRIIKGREPFPLERSKPRAPRPPDRLG